MKRRAVIAAGLAAALGAAVPGAAAVAAGTGPNGKVSVFVTPSSSTTSSAHPGRVVFTGAIGDYGTSVTVTATGKPSKKKSPYKLLKLSKGTILVDAAAFNQALTAAQPSTGSTATCSFVVTASGAVTIVKGTGAYSGVTGTVTLTGTIAAVLKTKKGGCTTKSAPAGFYLSIQGSGTVSS